MQKSTSFLGAVGSTIIRVYISDSQDVNRQGVIITFSAIKQTYGYTEARINFLHIKRIIM